MKTKIRPLFRLNDKTHIYIALFFIGLQILVMLRNYYSDYMYFFWLCDFIPTVYAFSFVVKDVQLIKGLINISFIPQAVNVTTFISKTLINLIQNIPLEFTTFYTISTIIMHLTTTYVLFLTFHLETKKESLYYSITSLTIIYAVMFLFTPIERNINYIFTLDRLGFNGFSFFWIPICFIIMVLPTYFLQKRLYKESKEFIKTNHKEN